MICSCWCIKGKSKRGRKEKENEQWNLWRGWGNVDHFIDCRFIHRSSSCPRSAYPLLVPSNSSMLPFAFISEISTLRRLLPHKHWRTWLRGLFQNDTSDGKLTSARLYWSLIVLEGQATANVNMHTFIVVVIKVCICVHLRACVCTCMIVFVLFSHMCQMLELVNDSQVVYA